MAAPVARIIRPRTAKLAIEVSIVIVDEWCGGEVWQQFGYRL